MKKSREEVDAELERQGLSIVERGTFKIPLPDDGEIHIDEAVIAATRQLLKSAHEQMDAQNQTGDAKEFIVTGKLGFGGGATLVIALSFTPPPEEVPEKPPVPFINITGGANSKGGH
jgi:hypothetical protein